MFKKQQSSQQITRLKQQVWKYKEQAIFWEDKYNKLKKQYDQLIAHASKIKNQTKQSNNTKQIPTNNSIKTILQSSSINLLQTNNSQSQHSQPHLTHAFNFLHTIMKQTQNQSNNNFYKKHLQTNIQLSYQTESTPTNQSYRSPRVNTVEDEEEETALFKHSLKPPNLSTWIRSSSSEIQKQRALLQIIYRYTFRQEQLVLLQDDPFDSRVNQIKYGTPYEDVGYVFEDYEQGRKEQKQKEQQKQKQKEQKQKQKEQKEQKEQQDNSKIKQINKKYVYGLIRPEIVYIDNKPYQTQIIYGFVTPFPFRQFFQDLHRTIQQQIKFQLFTMNGKPQNINQQKTDKFSSQHTQISKQKRISIISSIMSQIYSYCSNNHNTLSSFPIKLSIPTRYSKLLLQIPSQSYLSSIQHEYLNTLLCKYPLLKISKLIHYVLCEKQVIIVALTRKVLNQLFQMVRLMIKPFQWVFTIVYRYSAHFQPFLSSPMPLLVGVVWDYQKNDVNKNAVLMGGEFVTLFINQNQSANEKKDEKSSKKLKKQIKQRLL